MSDQVIIELIVDSKGAVQGIRTAGGEVVKFNTSLGEGEKRGRSFGGAMQVAFGVIAANAVTYLTRQLRNLVRQGFNMLNQSVQSAGTQAILDQRLAQALRNTGDESTYSQERLRSLANEMQSLTNFSNEQVQAAQALLLSFREVGGPDGVEMLIPRIADAAAGIASYTGQAADLNSVTQAIGRAMTQGVGALTRYGISLSDAQREAFAAATGMDRVRLLTEILDDNFRGLAEATADPFVQLRNATDDLRKTFGEGLLPVARAVANELRALAEDEEVAAFARRMGEELASAIERAIEFVRQAIDFFDRYGETMLAVGKIIGLYIIATRTFAATQGLANTQMMLGVRGAGMLAGAKTALTAATARAVVGIRAFSAAIAANPIGLLLTALATAISYFVLFRNRADDATDSLRRQREEALELRKEIDRLSGTQAAQRVIDVEFKIGEWETELAGVQAKMEEIRKEGEEHHGNAVEVINRTRELNQLKQKERALQKNINTFTEDQESLTNRVNETYSGQVFLLNRQIEQIKDRARLTDEEQRQITEIQERRRSLADDAKLTDKERKAVREELHELERSIHETASQRLPADKLAELERQVELYREMSGEQIKLGQIEDVAITDEQRKALRETVMLRREIEIEAMEEGEHKMRARVELEFDRRIAQIREKYPQLAAAVTAELEKIRDRQLDAITRSLLPDIEVPSLDLEPLEQSLDDMRFLLDGDFYTSIQSVDSVLSDLQTRFDSVETDEARSEIRELMHRFEDLRTEMESGATQQGIEDIRRQFEDNLLVSINQVDTALTALHAQFAAADTQKEREEIAGLIGMLERLRAQMQGVREDSNQLTDFLLGEGVEAFGAFAEGAVMALSGVEGQMRSFGNTMKLILADVARALGRMLLSMAAAAAIAGQFGRAARLTVAGGVLMGIGGAITADVRAAERRERQQERGVPGRRRGGRVERDKPYVVGEEGQELFIPDRDGFVVKHEHTQRLLAETGRSDRTARTDISGLIIGTTDRGQSVIFDTRRAELIDTRSGRGQEILLQMHRGEISQSKDPHRIENRALGGQVRRDVPYIVGENGREVFMPGVDRLDLNPQHIQQLVETSLKSPVVNVFPQIVAASSEASGRGELKVDNADVVRALRFVKESIDKMPKEFDMRGRGDGFEAVLKERERLNRRM